MLSAHCQRPYQRCTDCKKTAEKLKYIPVNGETNEGLTDRTLLNLADIMNFANTVDVEDLKHVLDPQIKCNMAIAEEGLRNNYGANIGSVRFQKMAGAKTRTYAPAHALWQQQAATPA